MQTYRPYTLLNFKNNNYWSFFLIIYNKQISSLNKKTKKKTISVISLFLLTDLKNDVFNNYYILCAR